MQCNERIWDPNKVLKWPFIYRCTNTAVIDSDRCADHVEDDPWKR